MRRLSGTSRTANIEPIARAIAERICRRFNMLNPMVMDEAANGAWVDSHWECAAAELAAGLIDESGTILRPHTLDKGLEAWREWRRSR